MSRHKEAIETLFNIYDKNGDLVPFLLNPVQIQIDKEMNENLRSSILKPRQKGCSSYIMARYLIDCMWHHHIVTMLAHDKDHTEKLLKRAQEFLINMNGPKPKFSKLNDNEIGFEKTQSSFFIGTAGSKNFGRSATITRLHMSELAFWKDPKGIRTGLLQAVPKLTGQVVEETTANGYGTWYQKYFYRLMSLTNPGTKPIFFPWNYDREYCASYPAQNITPEEQDLMDKYSLDAFQIQWMREKIEEFEFDIMLFKQEYPLSFEEAFKFSGGSLFPGIELVENPNWIRQGDHYILKGHPVPGYNYALGADSSGGTGNDEASIVVICFETKEQVYEWGNNRYDPYRFAPIVAEVGRLFNNAYIMPEANSHGISTIAQLKESYPPGRIFRKSTSPRLSAGQNQIPSFTYGWDTSRRTKNYAIGVSQKLFAEGFKVYSPLCYDQLVAFTEDAETKEVVNTADHDDRAMAYLLAGIGIQRMYRFAGILRDEEQPLLSPEEKILEKKKEVNKIIEMKKWRNEKGEFLLGFDDIFAKKPVKGLGLKRRIYS